MSGGECNTGDTLRRRHELYPGGGAGHEAAAAEVAEGGARHPARGHPRHGGRRRPVTVAYYPRQGYHAGMGLWPLEKI